MTSGVRERNDGKEGNLVSRINVLLDELKGRISGAGKDYCVE